jgi:hypothetical protein
MRGHIYPSIHQMDQIDRSLYHHHHCLLRQCRRAGDYSRWQFLVCMCNTHEYMHV